MKSSRFNVIVRDPESGRELLFNTLYGSATVLEPTDRPRVDALLLEPERPDPALVDARELLQLQRHLVDDSIDELEILRQRKIAGMRDRNRLDVIIMPTLDCNFACKYCYETRSRSVMSEATTEALRKWLEAEIPKTKVLLLSWFGGEPLLAYHRVAALTRFACAMAARAGNECVPHITTNGYLLDKRVASELLDAGLFDYQITMDGPEDAHDRFRVLRNGAGTFRRIFDNVVALVRMDSRVRVSLRVNFNHENLHSIPALLEELPQDVRPQLRVVYEPIFGRCDLSATDNLPGEDISHALSTYYALARDLGFSVVHGTNLLEEKLVYCYAERENQFIVNYNGDVFKCSVGDFDSKQRLGYLSGDGSLVREERWSQWMGMDLLEEECLRCVYAPLCMGGCRKMRESTRSTGSVCALVPTNATYLLKQIALKQFGSGVRESMNASVGAAFRGAS